MLPLNAALNAALKFHCVPLKYFYYYFNTYNLAGTYGALTGHITGHTTGHITGHVSGQVTGHITGHNLRGTCAR